MRSLVRVGFALLVPLLMAPLAWAGDGLALTPPMGWNSWNKFGCNVSEKLIRAAADALVSSGMKDAGYQYVVIDDCWQVRRDAAGKIVADPERFPSGIKALADAIHAKGLKFGIYSDAGSMTCAKRPGSKDHEAQDAKTYAEWGVDYLKYDWCNTDGQDTRDSYAQDEPGPARERAADRVFHLRVGQQQAVDMGAGPRAPVARHRRHPGLLGLRQELGRHGRGPHHRLDGRPVRLFRARPLERPGHARGR